MITGYLCPARDYVKIRATKVVFSFQLNKPDVNSQG